MFETSQDILNLAKTIGVLGLSLVLGLLIYYMAMTIRQAFKIVKEIRDKINKFDELMTLIKNKIENSTSHMYLLAEGVKKLVEIAKDYSEKRKEKEKNE